MPVVTLRKEKKFDCRPNQTLLDAAGAHQILLEHSCRTGQCGACRARVISGCTDALLTEASLTADQRAAGFILTCCRTATTEVTLDIEDLGNLAVIRRKTLPCRIDALARLTEDIIEVVLRTPPTSRLDYFPGQHIEVIAKDGLRRSYSLANAPRDDGRLSLLIRRFPDGEMSRYWFEEARTNDLLRLEGPLGTFFLRPTTASHLLLLATGTGIAPIRAMLEQLAANHSAHTYEQIHLYWGVRSERELHWSPDYPQLPLGFKPVLSRDPLAARTDKPYVQDVAIGDNLDLKNAVAYACGSAAMIESAREALVEAGLKLDHFHSDAFLASNTKTS